MWWSLRAVCSRHGTLRGDVVRQRGVVRLLLKPDSSGGKGEVKVTVKVQRRLKGGDCVWCFTGMSHKFGLAVAEQPCAIKPLNLRSRKKKEKHSGRSFFLYSSVRRKELENKKTK
jgi:hypothetical protein